VKECAISAAILISVVNLVLGGEPDLQRKSYGYYLPSYVGKRQPRFVQLPVGAVKPKGWLKKTLQAWGDGITGHLHEYRSDTFWNTWDNRRYRNEHREKAHRAAWWPFEQQAYWADGLVQTAHILNDKRLKNIAEKFIDGVLAQQCSDGYVGMTPDDPYSSTHDIYVMSELALGLMSHHSATQDPRIVPAMQKAFRHIYDNCKPLVWGEKRHHHAWRGTGWPFSCHIIDAVLWVYSKTGDRKMMDLANLIHKAMQEVPSDFETKHLLLDGDTLYDNHGVDVGEIMRVPGLYYLYSGDIDDLNASIRGLSSVDEYHLHVHGGPASDEHLREPRAINNTEFCTHVVFNYSRALLFSITGDVEYADAVERTLFNAAAGAAKPDGKGIQYFTAANQVACTKTSCNSPAGGIKAEHYVLRPDGLPGTQCCVGESTRLYPTYISGAMWFASADGGLAAVCYGPCTITAKVGRKGKVITITEETRYPFEERIRFVVSAPEPVRFPLYLRIPGWCKEANINVNDKPYVSSVGAGRMVRIERLWADGDSIELSLSMKIRFSVWHKGAVAVERGPLVYALKIKHEWKKIAERFAGFGDWEVYPGSIWNYALCLRLGYGKKEFTGISRTPALDSYFTVKYPKVPEGSYPWEYPPIELICKGKRVDGWDILDDNVTPDVPQSPIINDNPEEEITLVPYGCTRIRITYFPVAPRKQ